MSHTHRTCKQPAARAVNRCHVAPAAPHDFHSCCSLSRLHKRIALKHQDDLKSAPPQHTTHSPTHQDVSPTCRVNLVTRAALMCCLTECTLSTGVALSQQHWRPTENGCSYCCSPSEFCRVKLLLEVATISTDNLLTCVAVFFFKKNEFSFQSN